MLKKISLRRLSQAFFLGLILYLAYAHQKYGIEKAASIDAYCPFGLVEGFLTYLVSGAFLKRLFVSTFILGGIVFFMTFVFGRFFCSYMCSLGALQEWIRGLGRKIGIKKDVELPKSIDKYARYIKYIILLVIVYFSFRVGDLVFRSYDPFAALSHFGLEFEEKIIGYSLLIFALVTSLFAKGWWCRYFCPMGAFLGIQKKLSFFKINRDKDTCISCGLCNKVCPANLNIMEADKVKEADCISCQNCVSDCPKNSLSSSIGKKVLSRKAFEFSVLSVLALLLVLGISSPYWQTKAQSNVVSSSGEIDANNIRGSNTLGYLIELSGIEYSVFQNELGLPDEVDLTMKLKDIGPTYNVKDNFGNFIETESFREIVRNFQ
ncbi:hypothetical protein C0584_06065 [Candidatus Parcubacteria bacterium]|nr:MAG: hypothetical protein C0584_06065 [Candidatus Parcubacteria bacterium]